MQSILLIKKFNGVTGWEIDITNLPYETVLEIVLEETGHDYQVKRAPGRVIDECLNNMRLRAAEGGE